MIYPQLYWRNLHLICGRKILRPYRLCCGWQYLIYSVLQFYYNTLEQINWYRDQTYDMTAAERPNAYDPITGERSAHRLVES